MYLLTTKDKCEIQNRIEAKSRSKKTERNAMYQYDQVDKSETSPNKGIDTQLH